MNSISYSYHYRNLDSTRVYAERALALSEDYDAGKAEAMNNLAFVNIIRMNYKRAYELLDSIYSITDNQVELLVSEVQYMNLCQRESRNKEFYDYHERAVKRMKRIEEEKQMLDEHLRRRMVYASSYFHIVTSVYYYYVGLGQLSVKALNGINPDGEIKTDTAQLAAYYYNVGAGGIIVNGSQEEIFQQEFDYLIECYTLARRYGYKYWEANSLQALSEHLQIPRYRDRLIHDNPLAVDYVNTDDMPDSLIAGNLAQRSLDMFKEYGDEYQTAGAYRTLAQCYCQIKDYNSAVICLDNALAIKTIEQTPDLVASIREQLSVAYSAMNNKVESDYNRNIYLDLQEKTRQDKFFEARADRLDKSLYMLNAMITIIVIMTCLVLFMLYVFAHLRKKKYSGEHLLPLLEPLQEWQKRNTVYVKELEDKHEELDEDYRVKLMHLVRSKRRNLEQRAKISLVNSIMPLIDRMLNEIRRIKEGGESDAIREERYEYVRELTDKINECNAVLTEWIQLRQGELNLHIESFPVNVLFDIVRKSTMSFRLKGIDFEVASSDDYIKADRVLTLFMVNTLADNARKFTDRGGKVAISSHSTDRYVEISVEDTGRGIAEEQLLHIFDNKPIVDTRENIQHEGRSHGFGLRNCRGIMEKYRKLSHIFDVCMISAESEPGKGSRFYFRLPKGVARVFALVSFSLCGGIAVAQPSSLDMATAYADSAYSSNIEGKYVKTLEYADSCLKYLNARYKELRPGGKELMTLEGNVTALAPEVRWFHDSIATDYGVIMSVRNESAVAALALHRWDLYWYNNKVYTRLFREITADRKLAEYCISMQRSETNKNVAIVILVFLFLMIFPAYYFLYYRHHLYYRFCMERIGIINGILLGKAPVEEKLAEIRSMNTSRFPEELESIVRQITDALSMSANVYKKKLYDIEIVEDECRRVQYENDRLYVVNNVLDNCLSTLKHETMYYPSRIRQLLDAPGADVATISELASYYKELYSILSIQAMRQVESVGLSCSPVSLRELLPEVAENVAVLADKDMLRFLLEILRKANGKEEPEARLGDDEGKYVDVLLYMPLFRLTDKQCLELFSSSTVDVSFLLCRQIVRDIGEATNMCGCGIAARTAETGISVTVRLPRYDNK